MVIIGDRIYLREMTQRDFQSMYKVLADTESMKYYPYTFDEKRVKIWIDSNIERYKTFGFGLWAVCLIDSDELIGDCGITMQLINNLIKPEIGYHIRKDKQRMGYAKEATILVRDWAFTNTPFKIIYSYMNSANISSALTAISFGCHQVFEYTNDLNENTKVFAIEKSFWEKIK